MPTGGLWLDLCCGSGRALIDAAAERPDARLVGVDLVDYFDVAAGLSPELICASLATWEPDKHFDLITCVHGLHYVGDKLGLLGRAAGCLTPGGRFVADFEVASICGIGTSELLKALRSAGFPYDRRRHIISLSGWRAVVFPYTYIGADDRAGPNYTGQPAVHSYYVPTGASSRVL